jgi:hypothetical protein
MNYDPFALTSEDYAILASYKQTEYEHYQYQVEIEPEVDEDHGNADKYE